MSILQAALSAFGTGAQLVTEHGGFVQAELHQQQQLAWTQKQYRLDILSFAIDMLTQVKEEVKDLYGCYSGRIDNMLVVHTLFLTLGFAVLGYNESMFPRNVLAPDENYFGKRVWLFFFAVIQALSLVMPFWSVASLVRCRQHLDTWLDDSLRRLHNEFSMNMENEGGANESGGRITQTPDQLDIERETLIRNIARLVSTYNDSFNEMWRERCSRSYERACSLLWVVVVLATMDCAMQMSVFMKHRYQTRWDGSCTEELQPDETCVNAPEMWITYVTVLVIGCTLVLAPNFRPSPSEVQCDRRPASSVSMQSVPAAHSMTSASTLLLQPAALARVPSVEPVD